MTPSEILRVNLDDLERRVRRWTAPSSADEAELWTMMDGSLPGRVVVAVARGIDGAAPDSRAAQPLHRARAAWRAQAPIQLMRAVGATALLAALVHVALQATARPAGWWWLILPGLLATFGTAALGLSFAGPARKAGE